VEQVQAIGIRPGRLPDRSPSRRLALVHDDRTLRGAESVCVVLLIAAAHESRRGERISRDRGERLLDRKVFIKAGEFKKQRAPVPRRIDRDLENAGSVAAVSEKCEALPDIVRDDRRRKNAAADPVARSLDLVLVSRLQEDAGVRAELVRNREILAVDDQWPAGIEINHVLKRIPLHYAIRRQGSERFGEIDEKIVGRIWIRADRVIRVVNQSGYTVAKYRVEPDVRRSAVGRDPNRASAI